MSTVEKINSSENPTHPHILCTSPCIDGTPLATHARLYIAHATKVPGLIFLSGQTPVGSDGKLVAGGIQEHTVRVPTDHVTRAAMLTAGTQAQCIANLGNVLKAAGSSWEKVVKVNVYLKNMDDFAAMNEVYEKREWSPLRDVDVIVLTHGASPPQPEARADLHLCAQAPERCRRRD